MGVKNLKQLLKQCNNGITVGVHLNKYKNKKIAIDISNYMYRYKYRAKKIDNNNWYYLKYMFDLIKCLRQHDIIPIGVFDNINIPNIKVNEVQKRELNKQNKTSKIKNMIENIKTENPSLIKTNTINTQLKEVKNLTLDITKVVNLDKTTWKNITEVNKLSGQIIRVTKDDYNCCRGLLRYLGIPYITSENEADDMCGYLYKNKLIDGCLSEDTDMLAHGVGLILRNLNTYSNTVTEYKLNDICTNLGLSQSEFTDTCILMGTDYYKIYGLGPKGAFKLINKYKTIEHPDLLKELEERYNVDIKQFNYAEIKNVFNKYMDNIQYSERIKKMPHGFELSSEIRLHKLIPFIEKTCKISLSREDVYKCLNNPDIKN